MQHTKHYSQTSYCRAVHKLLLACSTRAHLQYTKVDFCAAHFVSHACFDSSHDKNWRTHVCSLHLSVNLDVSCTVYKNKQWPTNYCVGVNIWQWKLLMLSINIRSCPVYMCVCWCVHVCVCVHMFVCAHLYVCAHMCVCVYASVHMHVCICVAII